MFHIAAYTADPGAAIADARIAALADQVLTIRNNDFWLSRKFDLLFALAMGATLDDARLESPSLRLPTFPYINVNESVDPPSPLNLSDYRQRPFKLPDNEQLRLSATDAAALPGQITGIVGLGLDHAPAPAGNIVRLQGTSTTAVTANVWSSIEDVTYTNDLPDGLYALVGMEHFSANGQACRAIITSPGNQIYRPGCVSITALGGITHPIFRNGNLGKWAEFDSDNVPNLEVLANGADAAHTVYLDLVKIR